MMKSKLTMISIVVFCVIGLGIIVLSPSKTKNQESAPALDKTHVVNVDDIVNGPAQYVGMVGVHGTITKIDEPHSMFTLGCEDACILMSVKYTGKKLTQGSIVIAYGSVTTTDEGKYLFVAQEVDVQ